MFLFIKKLTTKTLAIALSAILIPLTIFGLSYHSKKTSRPKYDTSPPDKIQNNGQNSCHFDSLMLQLHNIEENIKELKNAFLYSNTDYLKNIFIDMQNSINSIQKISLDILEK